MADLLRALCNHPPQQTLHPSPPALPSSQPFREEGLFYRYARVLAMFLFRQTLHLRPKQAPSSGLFASCALQHMPQQTHHPEPPALPSSQAFREEGYLPDIFEG